MKRALDNIRYGWPLVVIALIICFLSGKCKAQALTYDLTQNIEYTQTLKNETEFTEYISADGSRIKIGDKLIIGRPSTNSNHFTYIAHGEMSLENALMTGIIYVLPSAQKDELIITNIVVGHTRMSRKSPVTVNVYAYNPKTMKTGNKRTILDFEKAFVLGEIINPNAVLTRDQAIAKLKESKELLDMQIIPQSKYDSIKAELTPIILKN